MRILSVIHTPRSEHSAVYIHYKELTRFLVEQGHDATVLTPEDFPRLRRYNARWLAIVYPLCVARWVKKYARAYDVISFHSYSGWIVNLVRRFVQEYNNIKTITSFHGLESIYYDELRRETARNGNQLTVRFRAVHGFLMPRLLRVACRGSDRVICRNKAEAARLIADGWTNDRRLLLVPNSVPQNFFIQRGYSSEARRLLFVGQWREMKGISDLVEAFVTLAQQSPHLELCCAGTLVEPEQVRASFPPELRERVIVRPRVSHDELIEIYRQADIFIFPTLSEGFSGALLEAMATGLPIVTTAAGAAGDLLEHGASAMIVPRRHAAAVVSSVSRLLYDAPARASMGAAAQRRARDYEMTRVHNLKLSIYQAIIQEEVAPIQRIANEDAKSCSTF